MKDAAGHVHTDNLRVQLRNLGRQLWDASRTMDLVQRVFPKDKRVTRARKDVSAALHGHHVLLVTLREQGVLDAFSSQDRTPATPEDSLGGD